MKRKFSNSWKGSKQARKQRKFVANAPQHVKQKLISAHLSKDLRAKYTRRSFQLRKGDTVKVMNGEYKGKSGKVAGVNSMTSRIAIEGIQITKKEGSKTNVYFQPSNLMITELAMDDKRRVDSINKNNKESKTENKTEAKK